MSELGLDLEKRPGHRALRRKRRGAGCLIGLIVLALVCGLAYVGISKGVDAVSEWLAPPEDYQGQGAGSVQVQIERGDTVAEIGRTLKSEDVVASVDAFVGVARADERAKSIQPGIYELREQMAAKWALEELFDSENRVEGRVTVPEGARVGQVVELISASTDITEDELVAALDKPGKLGLPEAADNNPEGYLFPATYDVKPGTKAVELLRRMVDKSKQIERELNISSRAKALGITTEEAVIVASIIEREARRDQDLAKVARVIYNRLEVDMALQMDSTVSYVSKRDGDPWTTDAERDSESQYNTYKHTGLPPGPIGSPGKKTLEAALNPAGGDWIYFVTTNFDTGKTVFTKSYDEHVQNVEKSRKYCRESDIC